MARIPISEREKTLQATRRRLLEMAAAEFADKGFSDANINHISLAAGFAKGTIYNYFPSKQDLLLALIAEAGALHMQYIAEKVRGVSSPVERLHCFFETGFRFIEDYPVQARFLITTLYAPGAMPQEAMYHAYQPMFRLVAEEIVAPGVEQGLFRAVNPQATATLLMTLYLGSGSHVDEQGKAFMDPHQVADFALHALQREENTNDQGK